jgi:hypothetical protein
VDEFAPSDDASIKQRVEGDDPDRTPIHAWADGEDGEAPRSDGISNTS